MKKISIILIAIMIVSLPVVSLAMNEETANVTRGEFVKDLLISANVDIMDTDESIFTDVNDPEIIPYIETAYNNGYISGFNQLFRPEDPITKEEAIIIIVNVFGNKNSIDRLSQADIDTTINFTDSASISPWAEPYISYALNKGFVVKENDSFYAQLLLTKEESDSLITNAKKVYEEVFTKDGYTASDLLVLSNNKIMEYDTYKQKGTMNTFMKMNIEGIPQEELENDPQMQSFLDEGTNMTIGMDISMQNPDKAYIIETIKSDQLEEAIEQQIEIFMDGTTMYTKMTGTDKWIKQDLSGIMNQLQSLSSNDPYQMSQLSEAQLNFFKDYAVFEDNVEIENKEYYVVKIDIDKETFKEYYTEIMEKTIDSIIELQTENPQMQADPNFDQEQFKQILTQTLSQMEIEVEYKYYINKETKQYEKLAVDQDMYIDMNNLIEMIKEMAEEEEEQGDLENLSVEMATQTQGEFELYDFNGEVDFPEIGPDDIQDIMQGLEQVESEQVE